MSASSSAMSPAASSSDEELSFSLQPDGRQVLTRKRARELLAPLSTAPFTSISLGGCALGDAAAGVAGPALVALANKQCVSSVTFADCIASLPQDEAIRSLTTLSSSIGMWKGLRSVDLSYNALGSIGIAHCAPLLQGQRRLEELRLVESGLAAESARLVKGFLCQGPTTQLRVLHLHANRVESAGVVYFAEVVEKSPNLESLRLSSLGARAPALATVASALKGKTNLRELDLSDNLLDVLAAQELADVIVTLPKLDRLVLRDLDMGDDALTTLLGPLAVADPKPPLVELALAGNELSPGATPAIATVVSAFAALLQVLDLSRNELGAAGAESLADVLADARDDEEPVTLTQLLLAGNEIPALPIVRLAIQLIAIPEFQCLDIKDNALSEGVFDSIATALGSNVVLYNVVEGGEEGEQGDEVETQADVDDDELQAALQELANAPSQIRKPLVLDQQPASSAPSSTQSKSTVSRLRSIFSRGSDSDSQRASSSRPTDAVEDVTESTRMAPAGSFEDDSGVVGDSSDPRTPPRASTITVDKGITVTSTSPSEAMSARETVRSPFTPASNVNSANANVIKSARKLKESIASLSKEISDVAGELQIPVSSSPQAGSLLYSRRDGEVGNVNEYLLVGDLPQERKRKQSALGVFVDVLGGLLVGTFVIILVLAIAQSQEESTFAYRLV